MNNPDDEMKPEYDFSGGVRGRHHQSYRKGTNAVLLDPDIARHFKDSVAVNKALRLLIQLANKEVNHPASQI